MEENLEEERLQKFIANQGICSRRKAEEYITSGRIKVNGNVIMELGTKIDPNKDIIEVDGKKISNIAGKKVYILLNKLVHLVEWAKIVKISDGCKFRL